MLHNLKHPRDALVSTMHRIYRNRMTTTSGGNLSIRDPDGGVWITPARVDKGVLTPRDIVYVRADGTCNGIHPPSSELPFHLEIYRRRPDLHALVHAHPGALVAFSTCRKIPETKFQPHVHEICGRVAIAEYACPGTQALGNNIAAAFTTGADCVLLENHGVVVGGPSLTVAFQRFETLEYASQALVKALPFGPIKNLSPERLGTSYTSCAISNRTARTTSTELELRGMICDFVHRGYAQRLLISTAGALSSRLNASEFLITPRRADRLELEPHGVVKVEAGSCNAGQNPSRSHVLHREIYAKHPDVKAIINAQPLNASVFCITDTQFTTRTIPESYVVLNDVKKSPFLDIVRDANAIAGMISPDKNPALIVENEGVVVVGKSLLEAFDRLEVLEATAEAIVMARSIGTIAPMSDESIDELRNVFKIH